MSAAAAEFVVAPDHPCLAGHFPGDPLVPGVVVLEHVLAAAGIDGRAQVRLPQVKFVGPLRPGEPARIELDGAAPRWRFRVHGPHGPIASGEIVEAGAAP